MTVVPKSFPPVLGPEPKILILGSMPGVASLKKQQYYAHPQNQFWRLLGEVLGEDLAAMDYPGRLTALKKRGVALWDVLASCTREGSLDADISDEEPNRVGELLRETGIKTVFLNGGKTEAAFKAFISDALPTGVAVHRLPSSSPAHAGLTFDEKLQAWKAIAACLTSFMLALLLLTGLAAAEPPFDLPQLSLGETVRRASADAAPPARAAPAAALGAECLDLPSVGCFFVPPGPRPRSLVVFFRGYHDGQSHIPQDGLLDSARAAFVGRGLAKAAAAARIALLVTGSSDEAVCDADVAAVERRTGARFDSLALAAHSGGNAGLEATLASAAFSQGRVRRVVMLDDFYSEDALAPLQELRAKGADCVGFFTWQSAAYVARARAYGQTCRLQLRWGPGKVPHDEVVNACLSEYLAGRLCKKN